MNVDDEDVVLFMDLASHLGGFGYHVAPPPEQSRWYQAGHAHLPRFEFTRWRRFVWLQAEAPLRLLQAGDKTDPLAWINSLRESSLVTKHHLQHLERIPPRTSALRAI